ncbi:hypothetical protein WMF38_57790 [Sorangium sp. So ce118]
MLAEHIERAVEARLRRVMFAIEVAPRTARAFDCRPPPQAPPLEVVRARIIEGCKRDAEAGLLEREVAWPCRQCNVVHQICDYCPLKESTE